MSPEAQWFAQLACLAVGSWATGKALAAWLLEPLLDRYWPVPKGGTR